jgi:tetratricopeptide (TPR) repeat protein
MPAKKELIKKKREERSKFVRLERSVIDEVANFLFVLGNQFITVNNAEAAFDSFKYSLDLNPMNQPAVHNLGAVYSAMGKLDSALRMFRESVRMDPTQVTAQVALAETLRKLGEWRECEKILTSLPERDREHYAVLSALAVLYYDRGRLAEAERYNALALEKVKNDPHMLLNRALIGMLYGSWPEFWADYEFNLTYRQNPRMKGLAMADAWDGRECPGQSLLVISDQGLGDAIQFGRYLPEAKVKGKFDKLIYLVQPELVPLLSRSGIADVVVGFGESYTMAHDAFSSLLGIMRVLQVAPSNCRREPHLVTDPKLDAVWAARLGERAPGEFRVGLAWKGDSRHGNDASRSMPFSKVVSLVKGMTSSDGIVLVPPPNVKFYSFQVGEAIRGLSTDPQGLDFGITDLGSDFRDFDDTASAMRQMDLVIVVDTAVSHIAGCLGTECWVLLSKPEEWRNLLSGDSVWYAKNKLFRQSEPRVWDPVVAAALEKLIEVAKQRT